jgi:hypothetical protein
MTIDEIEQVEQNLVRADKLFLRFALENLSLFDIEELRYEF